VSGSGVVTGHAAGSALITASIGGLTSNSVSVTVKGRETPSGRLSKEELKAKFKNVNPSELVYLSGITSEIAGKGDPTKFAGEAEQAGLSQHPLALELADLPKDRYGLIDWATAIKTEKVKPLHSLDPKSGPDEIPFQLDVVIFTKSQFQPDVIFPHYVHTLWLTCANCHPAIFPMNAKEANKMMTMPKIAAGEFCGRCHNRVAFPLSDCQRCHVKPKETPPLDPMLERFRAGENPFREGAP
jgi:c(7)-type cytochrome triheme protein